MHVGWLEKVCFASLFCLQMKPFTELYVFRFFLLSSVDGLCPNPTSSPTVNRPLLWGPCKVNSLADRYEFLNTVF
jgi:hypothetical protein